MQSRGSRRRRAGLRRSSSRGFGPRPLNPHARGSNALALPQRWRLYAALLVAGFLLSGSTGAAAYFAPAVIAGVSDTGHRDQLGGNSSGGQAPPQAGTPFTVLLLGSDDDAKFDPNHVLTQSMILVRVNPASKQATMMSIPRDLWVPISGGGQDAKIMTAYSDGGSKSAVATVENNFHVHIDDYVWIGLKGLVRMIDDVGGVDVITSNPVLDDFYPSDLDTSNPYGYTRVAVLPGAQHLDGANAMKYVRSRHGDLRGDLGRSQRQQQVLLALRARSQSLNLADLPDLASNFNGEFNTSITLDRARSLLPVASAFDNGNIKQIILGAPYTGAGVVEGQDVLLPDWGQILPLVRQNFP